jgi:2-dehydro-3-deoxygluconokinase
VGLNFTEVGTGVRGGVTLYDRGHSAASHLRPGMIDFAKIFRDEGVRWLHCGGIFPALSDDCAAVCREALVAAKAAGVVTSYDLNFRSSLGTLDQARRVTNELMPHVDVLVGNHGIIRALVGAGGAAEESTTFNPDEFRRTMGDVVNTYPNVAVVGTTIRTIRSGLANDWQGALCLGGTVFPSRRYENLEIEDRVGSGDGFCAGLAYGLLNGKPPQECVELAAALGSLLHTTPGDTSQVTTEELLHVAAGGGAAIKR